MRSFWGAVGAVCLAAMMAPLYIEQEESPDMGRNRRKKKKEKQQRQHSNINWSRNRGRRKNRKNQEYPKTLQATLFYTQGVKECGGET